MKVGWRSALKCQGELHKCGADEIMPLNIAAERNNREGDKMGTSKRVITITQRGPAKFDKDTQYVYRDVPSDCVAPVKLK